VKGAFSYASEKSKLLYLRQFPLIDNSHLSFAVETHTAATIASALESVFFGKASVLDALSEERQVALCSSDAAAKSLLERYAAICKSISETTIAGIGSGVSAAPQTIEDMYRQKDDLELALSRPMRCI